MRGGEGGDLPISGQHVYKLLVEVCPEAVDMNGRFQMQGGKNWFLPKEMNANRFFWDSHWLEIWSNLFYPSMGPNGGSVATDSGKGSCRALREAMQKGKRDVTKCSD